MKECLYVKDSLLEENKKPIIDFGLFEKDWFVVENYKMQNTSYANNCKAQKKSEIILEFIEFCTSDWFALIFVLFECVATSLLTCDSITKSKAICACMFVLIFNFPWCLDLINFLFLF